MNLLNRARVVVAVTVLSAAAGIAAGLGIVGLVSLATMKAGRPHYAASELFALGSQTGAALGILLGPIVAFGFMRRVSLDRLFGATAMGAARGGFVGYVVGALVLPHGAAIAAVLSGAVVGFGIAASGQWWSARSSLGTATEQPSVHSHLPQFPVEPN